MKSMQDAEVGKLVPQVHGGAIYQGAPKNPVAGPGRPPSELRRRLRGSLGERIKVLTEIADDETAKTRDRIRAIDLLAKYGLGTLKKISVDDVQDRLAKTLGTIRSMLPEDDALALIEEIRPIWT